eukprot:ANDGO_02478.mRNA.1 hypothetical protein
MKSKNDTLRLRSFHSSNNSPHHVATNNSKTLQKGQSAQDATTVPAGLQLATTHPKGAIREQMLHAPGQGQGQGQGQDLPALRTPRRKQWSERSTQDTLYASSYSQSKNVPVLEQTSGIWTGRDLGAGTFENHHFDDTADVSMPKRRPRGRLSNQTEQPWNDDGSGGSRVHGVDVAPKFDL